MHMEATLCPFECCYDCESLFTSSSRPVCPDSRTCRHARTTTQQHPLPDQPAGGNQRNDVVYVV